MYCVKCGTQIPDKSKFCSNCGEPQEVGLKENKKNSMDWRYLIPRKTVKWYLVWVVIHLSLLLTSGNLLRTGYYESDYGPWRTYFSEWDYFWPIGSQANDLEYYDWTEFLFYSIIPLVLIVVINLSKKSRKSK